MRGGTCTCLRMCVEQLLRFGRVHFPFCFIRQTVVTRLSNQDDLDEGETMDWSER